MTWVLNCIRSIILARLLFPEIYGLIALCLIVIDGIEVFTQTGFSSAIIYRQEKIEEAKDTTFTINVARGFILYLIAFLLAPFIANFYEKSELINIIRVLSSLFIFRGFSNVNLVILKKNLNFKQVTIYEMINGILSFVILISLVFFLRNIWALVISAVATTLIQTINSFILISGNLRFRIDAKILRELFSFGRFVTGVIILTYILTQCDKAFLGKVMGVQALGYYVLAFGLANLPALAITELTTRVMFPAYCKIQNDMPALQQSYLKLLKLLALLTLPCAVGITALAPEIVRIVYGEKWLPAVGALQVLCWFGAVRALSSTVSPILAAVGYPNIIFYVTAGRFIFLAAIIYPLTIKYGIIGTSYAVLIPIFFEMVIGCIYLIKKINIKISNIIASIAYPILCSLLMMIILLYCKRYISTTDIGMLIAMVSLGVFSYFILILPIEYKHIMGLIARYQNI